MQFRVRLSVVAAVSSSIALVASSACAPTNPYDPDAPATVQAKATIVGHLVGNVTAEPALLFVVDDHGTPVKDESGAIKHFPTLPKDAAPPAGLPKGDGKAFQIAGLTPGTYTVVFDATLNNEALLKNATSQPATLLPGDVVVRDIAVQKQDLNDVNGTVSGSVDGSQGGASFSVKLVAANHDPDLTQIVTLSEDGSFTFRHVAASTYHIEAAGDDYAPTSTQTFQVQSNESFALSEPIHLTTLGRVFSIDDFAGHDGQPPFAPFLPASPAHVAVAPLVLTDSTLVAFARVYTDDTRPGPEDGWGALTGADVIAADFDTTAGDGPRSLLAQLRICFGACTCTSVDANGVCTDNTFQPPLVSREIPLDFTYDATPPRAISTTVDDVVRATFPTLASDLEATPVDVALDCARFGDAECAAATLTTTNPTVSGDLVDDTSRVQGFALTLDDPSAPNQFTPLGTLGQLAVIQGDAPAVDKSGPSPRTLRIWAQDAAGNVGLVDVRTLTLDTTPIALANPALIATAGTVPSTSPGGNALIPGTSVVVDVKSVGEAPARWHLVNQGTARATGAVIDAPIAYTGAQTIDVSGNDGDTIALTVEAFDSVGNLTRTSVPLTLQLSRTSSIAGVVTLENRADATGASVSIVNSLGATVLTVAAGSNAQANVGNPNPVQGVFNLDGTYAFTNVPVSTSTGTPAEVYTVVASGPSPFLDGRAAVQLTPAAPSVASPIALLLPRGSLVGRFVLEGRETALTNSGIQVTLRNSLGKDVGSALTLADGTWRIDAVPVDVGYTAIGFFDGFVESDVPGIEVQADRDNIVQADANNDPTPIVLNKLSGDFRLCATTSTNVLDPNCAPVQFTNQSTVNIGGLSFDGIAQFRVSTTPFQETDATPAFVNVTPVPPNNFAAPQVNIGPTEGLVTVFLQLVPQGGQPGPVLQTSITFDVTPPQNVTATIQRGTAALVDGFTNETVGRVLVHADPGSGAVAPLKNAVVVFANSAPTSVPAQTQCVHDIPCAVPFQDNLEGTHTAFAFSCDAAGNCSTAPVSAKIAVDRTPPSIANGSAFAPSASFVQSSGGQLFTRAAQFDIAVSTGHNNVTDPTGATVADVFATKFGLSPVVDDGTFRLIPAPSPQPNTQRIVPGVSLPPVDGNYTIFAQLTDAAGNASSLSPSPFTVNITLDTSGPTVGFTLNNGASITNNPVVTLGVNDQSIDPTVIAQFNTTGIFVDTDPTTFDQRNLPLSNASFNLNATVDGQYTVFARFFDRAGNQSQRQATITLDRAPPTVLLVDCASCTKSNGAFFTNNASTHQIVLDTLASDNTSVVSVRTTVRSGALSGTPVTQPFAATQTVTLSVLNGGTPQSPDGNYNVDVVFIDAAGNSSSAVTVPVTLDTVAPTPSLSINGGALFTNNENVSLTLNGGASTAPIVGMRINNTTNAFSGQQQPPAGALAWQLDQPAVDGNKVVFLEATDAAGNVGTTSAQITLDKTPPAGTVTIAGGASRINTTTANVTFAYTLSDVAAFAVTTSSAGFPATCAGVAFTSGNAFPTQVTFAATSGGPEARTVSVCTKDRAGNTALATATTVLDQEFPTGSVTLNGGAQYTTSRNVTAAINAPADTAQIKTSFTGPGAATALDCTNATGYVGIPSPASVALSIPAASGAGLYTMQVCLKDSAGNISKDANGNPAPVTATIIFDAAAPTVALSINQGAAFTTNPTVNLAITASDDLSAPLGGVVSMRIANSAPTFTGATLPIQATTTTTVSAPTTEGSKTVCVEVTDAAGRTNNTCASITLQLTGPSGTVTIARATGNFSTASNGVLSTTFASSDAKIVSFASGQAPLDCGSVPAASFIAMTAGTPSTQNVTVAGGEGTRSVTGCFKSGSGLLTSVTDTVFVDPTDPPLAQALAPANNSVSSTRTPTFQWAAVNEAVTYTLIVRRQSDHVVVLSQAGLAGLSLVPAAPLPEVPLEWLVVAVKASGRQSAQDFTQASHVTPDATPPTAPTGLTLAVHAGTTSVTAPAPCSATNPCLNDPFPTLSFTAGTDTGSGVSQLVQISLATDVNFTSPLLSLTRVDGSAFDVPIQLGDGNYRWRVQAVDGAGNRTNSAVATFVVDRTPPSAPTIVPPKDPISQTLAASIPLQWSDEGASGAVNYRFEITTDTAGFSAPLFAATQSATSKDVKGLLQNGASVRHLFRVASIDAVGNQSPFVVGTFVNDTVAPCTVSSSLTLVSGNTSSVAGFSDSQVVTVQLSCIGDNPKTMQIGCDGVAAGKPFVAFANVSQCVLPGTGARTVQALISDDAGNTSAAVTGSINVDTTTPTTPVLATQNSFTNQATFAVNVASPSTDTNLNRQEFLGGSGVSAFTAFAGSSFNVALNNGDGNYVVRVRGVDSAGNVSPEAAVTITKDTVAPQTPIILGGANQTVFVNGSTFTFSLDPTSPTSFDANFDTYQTASCTGVNCAVGAFSNNPGNGTFTFNITANTSTTFAVRGHDKAGNVSAAASITVVEDSHNPRPVQLEPLPANVIAGAPYLQGAPLTSGSLQTRGPYVDVLMARAENVNPVSIDPNFDHFEIRGDTGAFVGFVPVCDVATPLCPIPFTSDTGVTVDPRSIAIHSDGFIAGFRVPVLSNHTTTFTLRSVDKAGNVSLETTTTTTDISTQRVTNDTAVEAAYVMFGDKIAYIGQNNVVHVKEAGADNLWNTSDDGDFAPEQAILETISSGGPVRSLAMGPNMVFYEKTVSSQTAIVMRNGGADGLFGTSGDNGGPFTMSTDAAGTVIDETKPQVQPSFWRDKLAWKQLTSGTETDVIVRQPGTDKIFGNSDDTFFKVGANNQHRQYPVVSGDNLAFLLCNNASASACPSTTPYQLVVINAGPDHIFGTGDDVAPVTLTNAVNIDDMRIELYTPGTPGRPACRNVVAYAGQAGPNKGVQVIATDADGKFVATDVPVQIMNTKATSPGGIRFFSLNDTIAAASDGFAPPFIELATAGKDGCFTRTADNLTFDSKVNGGNPVVYQDVLLAEINDSTSDLSITELGTNRPLWTRNEGTFFNNDEADRFGIAYGGTGVYHFDSRTMHQPIFSSNEVSLFDHTWAYATPSIFGGGTATMFIRDPGPDEIFGTSDDVERSGTHLLQVNNNSSTAFGGPSFAADETAVLWAGKQTSGTSVVPVLRCAGADHIVGTADDPAELEVGGVTPGPNWQGLQMAKNRILFEDCSDSQCSSGVGNLFVREVDGPDPCQTVGATVTQLVNNGESASIDGERLAFSNGTIHVIEAGNDHKLTATADNVQRDFFFGGGIFSSEFTSISGDRVVWTDNRTQTTRVAVGDLADLSVRTLTRTTTSDDAVSIEGDVISYGTTTSNFFADNWQRYYLGAVEPDLAEDFVNPTPSRLRCPLDDVYEDNDNKLTATPMNSGAALNAIVCKNDVDRYQIVVPANPSGCTIHTHVHFRNLDGDIDTFLFNEANDTDTNPVAQSANGTADDESINFAAGTAGGTFQLKVVGFGGSENTYDVSMNVTCP